MMRTSGRRRRKLPVNAEINITNLVDVAFVLLIIFIITAPIMQGGIEVVLPEADAAPMNHSDPVIVSIDAKHEIYVGEAKMESLDELEQVLQAYVGDDKDRPVDLRIDKTVPWEIFSQVLGSMNYIGLTQAGLPVQPRRR